MDFRTSRRGFLAGAAGLSAVAAGACRPVTIAEAKVEFEGAFPPGFTDNELLGPNKGTALLARNENPYGPAKSAIKMMDYAAKKGAYYPDKAMPELKSLIAERHGIDPDQIAVTTGSGEALCAIAVLYGPKGPIVAPRLFWDTTALYAQRLGLATIQRVPLAADMSVDLPAIEAAVTEETGLVQLCNPNNPTGMLSDTAELKASVKRMAEKTTVLVDEAYMELADQPESSSCIDLVKAGHDVIIARTFSKIYGMAGIRVGYTISSPETAAAIQSTAMSWISGVGLAGAIGAYNDTKFLDYSRDKIVEGRDMVFTTLNDLGLESLPSQTSFVYFKSGRPANDVRADFEAKDIIIRGQYMDYADWTRVSMGRIEDVERFCAALPEIVGA